MSTLTEIEEGNPQVFLPRNGKYWRARIFCRRFGFDEMEADERSRLLASLDEAEREIDAGLALSADQLREAVRSWAGR